MYNYISTNVHFSHSRDKYLVFGMLWVAWKTDTFKLAVDKNQQLSHVTEIPLYFIWKFTIKPKLREKQAHA